MAKKTENQHDQPSHEEIARRAFALFEQSGRVPGRDMENWLQAEAQLFAARKGGGDTHSNGHARTRERESYRG
jgi:hypothetical protein